MELNSRSSANGFQSLVAIRELSPNQQAKLHQFALPLPGPITDQLGVLLWSQPEKPVAICTGIKDA